MINVVGNATSLIDSGFGELIDSGYVVRFNQGIPTHPEGQGSKTDLIVTFELYKACKDLKEWDPLINMLIIPQPKFNDTGIMPLSTLTHFLTMLDGFRLKDVNIFGVDYNKSWSFYQDHKGYPHRWEKEQLMHKDMLKRNPTWRFHESPR